MKGKIAVGMLALAGMIPVGMAQSLPAAGDTFFAPGNVSNFSTSPTINVGGTGAYQGLLQFDLATLPAGTTAASISKATLVLFVNKVGTAGAVDINAANGPWSEAAVNGTNAPVIGGVVANQVAIGAANQYITVDATAMVKNWINGLIANDGLILSVDPGFPNTSVFFDSKESATTSHPAVLQITLLGGGAQGPAGPQGLIGPQGPQGLNGAQGLTGAQGPQGQIGPAGPMAHVTFQTLDVGGLVSVHALPYPPPDNLGSLIFTPAANGTAVISGRGDCSMVTSPTTINFIQLVPAPSAAVAFNDPGFNNTEPARLIEETDVFARTYHPTFTTQVAVPVVAGQTYTYSLFARHFIGGGANDTCFGTLSVQLF